MAKMEFYFYKREKLFIKLNYSVSSKPTFGLLQDTKAELFSTIQTRSAEFTYEKNFSNAARIRCSISFFVEFFSKKLCMKQTKKLFE